jgi:hypothetical protein
MEGIWIPDQMDTRFIKQIPSNLIAIPPPPHSRPHFLEKFNILPFGNLFHIHMPPPYF